MSTGEFVELNKENEHILVCLSSSPSNEKIIRTAAKMAREEQEEKLRNNKEARTLVGDNGRTHENGAARPPRF